jgi:nitrogen fixation protein FixH
MTKQLTGRHVLMIFCGAFGVIISVNLLLAYSAVSTFPGLEVKNSYVASQQFDERKAAQEALGWTVRADAAEGQVILRITGADGLPVRVGGLEAVIGRATHVADDMRPEFIFDGVAYVAQADLADGNWNIRMTAQAEDGTPFAQRVILHVKR